MTFTRTRNGLSNLRLFVGVDLIVFTEGGPNSFNIEEASRGEYHEDSADIDFWQPLFTRYKPDLSFSFRAMGTKNTIKTIARHLEEGTVTGVCVVMDRDFDELFSQLIFHHRVLYTHKYSWESELLETSVILRAFLHMDLSKSSKRTILARIRPVLGQIRRDLKHFTKADAILWAAGNTLFQRKGVYSALHPRRKSHPPRLNHVVIRSRLRARHAEIKGYRLLRAMRSIDVKRHCFGKLLLAIAVETLHYLMDLSRQPKMPKDYCVKFLTESFHAWLDEKPGSPVAKYYTRIVSSV